MVDLIQDVFGQIRGLLTPPRYFAWQTILLLSLFSWLMAAIAEGTDAQIATVNVLSTASWMFLTIALWWGLSLNPPTIFDQTPEIFGFTLGPWITGAVMCIFLFNPWTDDRLRLAVVSWPVLATLVAALPRFVNWKLELKLPKKEARQPLLLLLLVNLLLMSWLMFHFRVQDWLKTYPSLMAEDIDNSAFVFQVREPDIQASQGIPLLNNAASLLKAELDNAPWPRVERWLLNLDEGMNRLASRVNINADDERTFWSLDAPAPAEANNGYQLRLRANWLGPTALSSGHFYEKVCTIVPRQANPPTDPSQPREVTPVAQVTCESSVERRVREPVTT
ncbi:MAG: DUF5357 family protein [Cyanobacteria bacterium J06632_22]